MISLNATLIGQMITFGLFVWFTMKYVWPHLMKVMEERREKIADGLAAAERGKQELEYAEVRSKEIITEAKADAAAIIEQANQRANNIIEEGKSKARTEGERLLRLAQNEIEQEYNQAQGELTEAAARLAIVGAEKILNRNINPDSNDQIVDQLVRDI